MRIANYRCREAVMNKEEFCGSNLLGVYRRGYYVVYSYGYHFPIYAYSYVEPNGEGKWYGNENKYSVSTSKHQIQARPNGVEIQYVSTAKLIELIEKGF